MKLRMRNMRNRKRENDRSKGPLPITDNSYVNSLSFVSVKLEGKGNFKAWVEQMKCFLEIQGMFGFVDGSQSQPVGLMGSDEWRRSDTIVKGWIYGSLCEDVRTTVLGLGLQTAHEVWVKINKYYSPPPPPPPQAHYEIYLPLYKAIETGDWEKAKEFFIQDKNAFTYKIDSYEATALHVAVSSTENIVFLEKLLDLIDPNLLPNLVNKIQENPLHYAAQHGNTKSAMMLVVKNPEWLFMKNASHFLPIHRAIYNSHKPTFRYLLKACKQYIECYRLKDGCCNPFEGEPFLFLLHNTMLSGSLDDTYALLKTYPQMAATMIKDKAPLKSVETMLDLFRSAQEYNLYQRFLYYCVPLTDYYGEETYKNIHDIENHGTHSTNHPPRSTKNYVYYVIKMLYVKFWKLALLRVPHIKRLHDHKVKHGLALSILELICNEVGKLNCDHHQHYRTTFTAAVSKDTIEVVEEIIKTFPLSVWTKRYDGYLFSQISILERSEKVFNFMIPKVGVMHKAINDEHGNNLLHLAGRLPPKNKLNMVTGAALQMQREIQWFTEVSKYMLPKDRDAMNKKGETPIMVFRAEHEELRQKGEEWLIKTADSYTIVAALIITIVFAAAITVPGGNNDSGNAIYEAKPSFIIFVISDAISLFTSTTSLLLFLSILTARYAEEDFLYKLPKRLILGLVMLFMSVTTMMIAFSATLYVTFGEAKSWILIPIAAVTCLPIASFVTLQLPLLADLTYSTYGHRILTKNVHSHISSS